MQNIYISEEPLLEEEGVSSDGRISDEKEETEEETYDNYEKDWDEEV